ncbi:regulator of chromosome condensation, RCC1 [Vulgatibacter incomptus]|uniref:Regulator of chromosome condensation, RCC1 n=1 Tax=Vulgatibacter incomptus TaxID=1391653 RepID=A0A0K1PBX1_9BACT|nr:regulator of chromosome condensation, RCC1 [Vulgatibacter incomptus]
MSSAGVVTGLRVGTVKITAEIEGVAGETTVTVAEAAVARVIILNGPYDLVVGEVRFLVASVVDNEGLPLLGRTPTWSSSNAAIASVDSEGNLSAIAPGVATVAVEVGSARAETSVTVHAATANMELAMGRNHTCLLQNGEVWCWGSNAYGQLGTGASGANVYAPVQSTFGLAFRSLSAGEDHTCGVTVDDELYCWGRNDRLQLGRSGISSSAQPILVVPDPFAFVTSSYRFNCAADLQGHAWCWGYNSSDRELGYPGETNYSSVPLQVASPVDGMQPIEFAWLSGGLNHTCGLSSSGELICWGYNGYGQLATGDFSARLRPTSPFPGLTLDVFGTGENHVCANDPSGTSVCWGESTMGKLGNGTAGANRSNPVQVSNPGVAFVAFTGGIQHTCALDSSGAAWCWGSNARGQLGRPGPASEVPVQVAGDLTFTQIAAREHQTCAIATDGSVYCWGSNANDSTIIDGRLGIGRPDLVSVDVPTAVQF